MKIVADENIPYVQEAFGALGECVLRHGRQITPADLADADALLVRSVTRVNDDLLANSKVRFVGTATIGVDHVDEAALARRGIAFASAQGCNANSVAEYVLTVIHLAARRQGWSPAGRTVGVVGCGNVGRKVVRYLRALGLTVLVNDPPLQRRLAAGDRAGVDDWLLAEPFVELDEVLERADIVTLHVPLTKGGPDSTHYLLEFNRLSRLREGALVINSSRGAVVQNAALALWLETPGRGCAALDVWEKEPAIDWDLFALRDLLFTTPHIAGYSFDGKVTGTRMIHEALCRHLGRAATWTGAEHLGPRGALPLAVDWPPAGADAGLARFAACLATGYDLPGDDRRLRAVAALPADQRAKGFDDLRKNYPRRREYHNYTVHLPEPDAALAERLRAVGFVVAES